MRQGRRRVIRAAAIDSHFAPKIATGVCDVEVDGEVVVFHEETHVLHLLNPTAGAAWRCFDGSVSLEDLAGELAEVYGEDRATVEVSLLEVARSVGALGLLDGVEAEEQA